MKCPHCGKEVGTTVKEAGHKGGSETSRKYGPEFYEEIGRKGGRKTKELVEAGKKALGQ